MTYPRLLAVGLVLAAAVFPQSSPAAPPNIELVLSAYRIVPSLDTSYAHSYMPRLEYGTSTGTARQVLDLKANSLSGFGFGFNMVSTRRIGVQVLYDSFSTVLEGSGGPYVLSMEYQARQPPQYELRTYTYERASPRPPAEGTLKETAVSLNLLYRWFATRSVAVDVSAGPTLFFVSAAAETLLYTKFWLGGHSVLFLEDYDLKLNIPRSTRLGLNTGVEFLILAGRHLAFGVGGRYFLCPATNMEGELELIERPEGSIREIDLVRENIPVAPLRLNPSFLRLSLSARIRI